MAGQQYCWDFDSRILGSTLDSYLLLYFMPKGMKCSLKASVVRKIFGKSGNKLEYKAVLQLSLFGLCSGVP